VVAVGAQELGLPERPDAPLLGFIGRLDYQKGVDLIRDSYDWLMGEGCQLVMLGSGTPDLEAALRWGAGSRGIRVAWPGWEPPAADRLSWTRSASRSSRLAFFGWATVGLGALGGGGAVVQDRAVT
jgi:glycosyltransferase involved in cell wall biosynthesis